MRAGRKLRQTSGNVATNLPVVSGAGLLSQNAWSEVARSLGLSRREVQITRGVFENQTELDIAMRLGMSEHTVHGHLNRLFKKLGVGSRVQLVLRIFGEWLILTMSDGSRLTPICPNRAQGRCQRK